MSPTQKQLELRMKVTADVSDAARNLQQLAAAQQQAQGRGGAPGFSGYIPPGGFGAMPPSPPGPGAAGAPRPGPPSGPFTSPVSAFDRPIPVIIVGPKPLHVTGAGTGGGGPGGGGDKEKDRHEALLTSLRNLQLGGPVARYEQIKGFGDAAKGLGIPGGAMISRAALPLAIGMTSLKTAGEVGDIVSDEYTTDEQKARQAFRRFVPGGDMLQDAVDGLSGRRAGMEKAEVDYQKRLADVNARVEKAGFNLGYRPEQAGFDAREGLLTRATPILEGPVDRSTAAGDKRFRDAQRLLPIAREEARLQREAAAATAQRAAAEAALGDIQAKRAAAQRTVSQKGRELSHGDNQSGVSRHGVLLDQAAGSQESERLGELEKQAQRAVVEARRREAESGRQAGQMGVQRLQSQADILEGDASQAASGAQALGGMDRFSRANAVRSLQLLQQLGPDRMSPRELAEARSVAPQTVAKILETAGKGTREFDSLRQFAPADYAGDPEELRKQAQKKRDEAAGKELDLDRELGAKLAASGRDLGQYIGKLIDDLAREIKAGIDRDKRIGKGANS